MVVQTQLCFLLFGTCLVSLLLLLECRKLEGYAFPVFSTKECPGNPEDWKNRSSVINCTDSNGYMCTPNENFTELLEFCYIYPRILVQKDLCLYLVKRFSRVNSYNCRKFSNGCPELTYFSSETYTYPSCMKIENGCFSAELSCKRQPLQSKTSTTDTTLPIILGVSIPLCLLCILCILVFYMIRKKYRIFNRKRDIERSDEDIYPLLSWRDRYKDSESEIAMFDQWKQDDSCFITTKACEEVEKQIKSRNLVIVAGHSGSGKSAIIHHIALKYREHGWTVKRVTNIEDISKNPYAESIFFVFDDPFENEFIEEILITSWKMNIKSNFSLRKPKLLMSCRKFFMSETRITHYLMNQSDIVDIDSEIYKLSDDEKRQIFTRYTSDMNLSDNEVNKIVEVERYFPLLCKLYSSKENKNKDIIFFTEPETVLKDVILEFQKKDKDKYCALALLVLFNDDLCPNDLLENEDTENKFKHTLKLCGLTENKPLSAIEDNLNSLKDFLVINVGDKYRFCHDFVMEVTTYVFGTEYPDKAIEYTDIRLLRKRVRLSDCEELTDPFTLYLSDNYIEKLGERLLNELIKDRFMDVVLNPCMKEKRMIEVLKKMIQKNPGKLPLLLEKKKNKHEKPFSFHSFEVKQLYRSKLVFIGLDSSPLFALIVLSHTDFSLECLNTIQQISANSINSSLLTAVYCNGSIKLFHIFSEDRVKESLKNYIYGYFQPIHIVSVYHNYEILKELIEIGVKIDSRTIFTSLLLAVGNDTQRYKDYAHEESGATRRDKTVQLLLNNGANINFSNWKGTSPLHIACKMGYNSTVTLLLSNGAKINSTTNKGASPLSKACKKGYNSIVELLLRKGAKLNLPTRDGVSPLLMACQNGHVSTVQLLLSKGADINLCMKDGASPLYIACQNGYESIVEPLLSKGADINLCVKDGASPLHIACQNGHDSTVQLLLSKGADINLRMKDGARPLHLACQNGHDSTLQLLLSNGADINVCMTDGARPLHLACQNGHDSTLQLLLSNGADINVCMTDGARPLHTACQNGHDFTVQLLLSNGADINLPTRAGYSPLYIACRKGHDSTVQLLLSNGAYTNLRNEMGASPLHIACKNGHYNTVQLLLSNGADINLCMKNGTSPLYIACEKKHYSTIQLLLNKGADVNVPKVAWDYIL